MVEKNIIGTVWIRIKVVTVVMIHGNDVKHMTSQLIGSSGVLKFIKLCIII